MDPETPITATVLARSLSEILNRVKYGGERFLIRRGGKVVGSLGPAGAGKRPAITLRSLAHRMRGNELPGDGFADDLEAIQAAQGEMEIPPWPS
jgi:hypothetical protein